MGMGKKRGPNRSASVAGLIGRMCMVVLLAAAVVVAPNLLWLGSSTVLLQNHGAEAVEIRLVVSDEPGGIVDIGRLDPGHSRFMFLEMRGEASLQVAIRRGGEWLEVCREYVEEAMYRVEVLVTAPDRVRCRVDLPIFDHLLVADLLP